jgi:hypothetical protein
MRQCGRLVLLVLWEPLVAHRSTSAAGGSHLQPGDGGRHAGPRSQFHPIAQQARRLASHIIHEKVDPEGLDLAVNLFFPVRVFE